MRFVIPLCKKELLVPGQASVPLSPIVTPSNAHRYFWPSMGLSRRLEWQATATFHATLPAVRFGRYFSQSS